MNAALSPDARLAYAASFARSVARRGPEWLASAQRSAFASFVENGWPTTKNEAWRFTDTRPVQPLLLPAATVASLSGLVFDESLLELGRGRGHRLVFLDGHRMTGAAAWQPLPPGLVADSLSRSLADEASPASLFLDTKSAHESAFVALNTAFMSDGAFIHIPAGLAVEVPILLVYLAAAEGGASHPRTIVLAEANSRATIIELHLGADGRATLSNAVTEIRLRPGARVAYHAIARPSPSGFHLGHLAVAQGTGSTFLGSSLTLDGRLVRNDAHVVLDGPRCTCRLDGIYLAAGTSHIDNHTSIDHRSPDSTSRESYKGVAAGHGQAVWTGRAIVRPGARGTDARQTNRNLILDDGAEVHAKPHLEIFASDVKCSHGATTGRLDQEALFYLRSRGIGESEATQILVAAFLREGLSRIADAPLRGEIEAVLAGRARDLAREGATP
jgi:Fe-S cluster assembly protein SufD